MNHVIIIHGWKGKPETNWKPWLKKELEREGWKVDVPAMPHTDHPVVHEWVEKLTQTVGKPDKNTYLIGHSCGTITILKYLETLKEDEIVGGVVLVAGFGEKFEKYQGQHDSFFDKPLNWEYIRKRARNFAAINSDDDPYIGLDQMELFKNKLGAKCVILHGMGHFGSPDGVFELPTARDEVLTMAQNQ